jgi:hypothetical protein
MDEGVPANRDLRHFTLIERDEATCRLGICIGKDEALLQQSAGL